MEYQSVIAKKGRRSIVRALRIEDLELIITGRLLRTIRLKEEWDTDVTDPESLVRAMKSQKVRADLFTFAQRLPHTTPAFKYHMDLESVAALPISSYDHWWAKQVNYRVRTKIRKSIKQGVVVRKVPFDDDLVRGIHGIYNETPVRQGKPFWHFGKSLEETKEVNSTFLDRADFIGAYLGDELIGFIKLVYADNYARFMQILVKNAARDKAPMNALIDEAVRICAQKGIPFLKYDKLIYGSKGIDTLAEFKLHNGFLGYELPRYHIPLSLKGRIALALNLHKSLKMILPSWVTKTAIAWRKKYYSKKDASRQDAE
jgi:hypothetical protein